MERRVEWNGYSPPYLDVFKISKGKGVISFSSCLDVLKIRIEMRGNYLNRQFFFFF